MVKSPLWLILTSPLVIALVPLAESFNAEPLVMPVPAETFMTAPQSCEFCTKQDAAPVMPVPLTFKGLPNTLPATFALVSLLVMVTPLKATPEFLPIVTLVVAFALPIAMTDGQAFTSKDAPLIAPAAVTLNAELVISKVFAPTDQVELAAPVRFRAPADVTAKTPDVVVDRVSGPDATVIVKPPVEGPVMVRALVPLKVMLPPWVKRPVPVVMALLLVVPILMVPLEPACMASALAVVLVVLMVNVPLPVVQVELPLAVIAKAPVEVRDGVVTAVPAVAVPVILKLPVCCTEGLS